jgi:hypothetical protein
MQTRWPTCEQGIAEKKSPAVTRGAAASITYDGPFSVGFRGTPGTQYAHRTGMLLFGFFLAGGDLFTSQFG